MKPLRFLFIFIFLFFLKGYAEVPVEEAVKVSNIRVLLEKEVSESFVEVKGSYNIVDPFNGSNLSTGLLGKRFMLRTTNIGLKWGEEFPGVHQISIIPKNETSSILINGVQYDGSITVFKIGDKINIINEVPIESYIKSTLSVQIPYPYESEVMNAIAIAARTTAYYNLLKSKDTFWHTTAQDLCYPGTASIVPNSQIAQSVDSTSNIIMVHPTKGKNVPFAACWTEHSAGKTAAFKSIFRKDKFSPIGGVSSSYAAMDRDSSKWNFSMSTQKFAELVNLKHIKNVELFLDKDSGKTYAVRIKDNGSSFKDLPFSELQNIVGKNHLLSNDLQVAVKNNDIIFSGYGKGLGVGLCIYTASAMAQNGDLAIKILTKFFPNTYLLNLTAIPKK